MRIAICDDSRQDAAELLDMLTKLSESTAIDCFENGRTLLETARANPYDLVFMDVYLREENGVEVARELRAENPETQVAFTTVSDAHAVEAFSVRAIHYLVKPYGMEEVTETLRRVRSVEILSPPESTLTVRIGNDIYTLVQRDILRVEASDHKTNIFMRNRSVYSIWMVFRKVVEQLDDTFLQIKRGVAVNMRHIRKWSSQEIETADGMRYLLNREKRQQLKETYFAFKMNQLEAGARRK